MALKVLKLLLISAATWIVIRPFVRGEGDREQAHDRRPVGAGEQTA